MAKSSTTVKLCIEVFKPVERKKKPHPLTFSSLAELWIQSKDSKKVDKAVFDPSTMNHLPG